MNAWLDSSLIRYSLSGTLILVYMIADRWVARREPARPRPHASRGVHALIFISLTAYYALIGPTGGPLLDGLGNLAGVALVGFAVALRAAAPVRHPELAARGLFYVALPIAVGVPWGLLALSLPACAISVWVCLRRERLEPVPPAGPRANHRYRLVPGIW